MDGRKDGWMVSQILYFNALVWAACSAYIAVLSVVERETSYLSLVKESLVRLYIK